MSLVRILNSLCLQGICRLENGFVVFVDRALPGERLLARVVQSKRSFARASRLRSLAPHDDATEPVCEVSKSRPQVQVA